MRHLFAAALLAAALPAFAAKSERPNREEEELFNSASQLYGDSARDKAAAIEAFERFLSRFPNSPRAADAQFMAGEGALDQALKILKNESESKKNTTSRLLAPKNQAAVQSLKDAEESFNKVLDRYRKADGGLRSSAQYRVGETAYNGKDWGRAIEEWRRLEKDFAKSYLVPEAWMGIIFANLALEQFSQAEANLFLLGETFPRYLKVPEVLYVQGIISLHKGDYSNAEKSLALVKSAEAQFYLGKTYLLSKRPYLAAAAFERLVREYPDSVLIEETEFFIGDSFFLAKDFDGGITKYQRFLSKYPDSPLRVSALFRIGSSQFQKGDYIEARAHFQSVIDRYPRDFFAPLAQYFIAESYLVAEQYREGLFAYTKVITQYPETIRISPLAHYKLAWTQTQVGDYGQAAQTCRNFLSLYPTNALAKNVYIVMANALLAMKRHDEAVTAFQRIIDLAPTSDIAEQALFSILKTQHERKRYNAILTSYQFIFRHLPPSQSHWRSLSYLYAAEAYINMNRVDEAKAIYEMVLKVYPHEQAAFYAQDGLAWAYQMLGDDEMSLEMRRKLTEMMAIGRSSYSFSGANQLGIADSMYNQKQYEEAFQLYDKFVRENVKAKQAPQALYRAGMSLYHLRYYTQAIDTWTKLRDQFPQAPETPKAEYQIGDTMFRAQKYADASAQYRRVIETYKDSDQLPLAYLRVAMSAFNAKDDAGTLKGALALIGRFPSSPEATDALDLMETVYDRSSGSDFKSSLRAVVEAAPGAPIAGDAQFRIGRRLFETKRYADAAVEFQKFSVDFTGNAKLRKAQFLLAESYFNAEKHDEAVRAFGRFLENFPSSEDTPLALFHLASAHYALKDFEPAAKNYQRLIDEYSSSEYSKAALYNLALAYKATGKLDRAEESYRRYAHQAAPGDAGAKEALWELLAIQKERKDFAAALQTLDRLMSGAEGETMIEATYRKGEVYLMMDRKEEAVMIWESLVAMVPKGNAYRLQGLIQLGEEYEKRKESCDAASVYDDIGRNSPQANVAAAARERAKGLKAQASCGGKAPASKRRDTTSDETPLDLDKTQVMPDDEVGPAEKAPAKKPSAKKSARPAKASDKASKEINIPGMN
ncbi:MAG: tetratricopeptide repeat protein [Elusimicrobia bacterium]|nr:tetratricopeptide repeat protein [Elusimicrobiota bacterium]